MKKFFIFLLFSVLAKITLEEINYKKSYDSCGTIRAILEYFINYCVINKRIKDCYDGFNPQNCNLRDSIYGNKCCYVSLRYNGTLYNFCGSNDKKVKTDIQIQEFMKEMQKRHDYLPNDTNIEEILSIDCAGEKTNYKKVFSLIIFILLI